MLLSLHILPTAVLINDETILLVVNVWVLTSSVLGNNFNLELVRLNRLASTLGFYILSFAKCLYANASC